MNAGQRGERPQREREIKGKRPTQSNLPVPNKMPFQRLQIRGSSGDACGHQGQVTRREMPGKISYAPLDSLFFGPISRWNGKVSVGMEVAGMGMGSPREDDAGRKKKVW